MMTFCDDDVGAANGDGDDPDDEASATNAE